jgi:hypothetical protein
MKTINLNTNLSLNVVNITLCNIRPKEGCDLLVSECVS